MTPKQLRHLIDRTYESGGQTKLANELGVDPSTVRRWLSGKLPIREITARAIRAVCKPER